MSHSPGSHHRACAALIIGDSVLMVKHVEPGRVFWTLPGGGVLPDETPAEAAVRETREETGLRVRVLEPLWDDCDGGGCHEHGFLVELELPCEGLPLIELGHDPEEAGWAIGDRTLQAVEWRRIGEVADDVQVARICGRRCPDR